MAGDLLRCAVCGTPNVHPNNKYTNMPQKMSATVFCSTCGDPTLHHMTGANDHVEKPKRIDLCQQIHGADADNLLWKRLQDTLASNGATTTEFLRCDASTQNRLLLAVGFNSTEIPLLMQLAELNKPRKINGDGIQRAQQPTDDMEDKQFNDRAPSPDVVMRTRTSGENSTNFTRGEGKCFVQTTPHSSHIHDESLLRTELQGNGTITARCSVYPHLPAEFWCSLCGVPVSSRCHVAGVHKDHPFITLRQAAEEHVRDLGVWSQRCRNQMNVATTVLSKLHRGKEILNESIKRQEEALDAHFEEIIRGFTQWHQELKSSMRLHINAQLESIDIAVEKTKTLVDYYTKRQARCDPLLQSIPPMHEVDKTSEEWFLQVMDLVTDLKTSNQEPIPMPRLSVPDVKCSATLASYMDLLKVVTIPAGISLPDVLDTGHPSFPNPSEVEQEAAFTLQVPNDANVRGLLIYGGRTLTRSHDITPAHSLVCASRIFYTGITSWKVHIDSLGVGPGRVLAGVLMAGTDGEGVVWDGQRIVGPGEGECRTLPEQYRLKAGTTLQFVLELEEPAYFLICYYEDDVVARVPLPLVSNGWIPAFSIFGPQDQLTVVPTSTSMGKNLLFDAVPEGKEQEEEVRIRLGEHKKKLNALHEQFLAVNSQINQDMYEKLIHFPQSRKESKSENYYYSTNGNHYTSPVLMSSLSQHSVSDGLGSAKNQEYEATHDVNRAPTGASAPTTTLPPVSLLTPKKMPGHNDKQNSPSASSNPELRHFFHFVESIR